MVVVGGGGGGRGSFSFIPSKVIDPRKRKNIVLKLYVKSPKKGSLSACSAYTMHGFPIVKGHCSINEALLRLLEVH